ncbi:MAG TPA: hypothetical protein VHD63_11950 [Ktedonobacteraceae bacterium]|nr:hypothetical protein [Ktedonobacteraceae bacterium]
MAFPYREYETLDEQFKVYYPKGEEELARQLSREVQQASTLLSKLLKLSGLELEILLVAADDWRHVPLEDDEEEPPELMLPYWTSTTDPPSLVVPVQMDEVLGEATSEKRALLLYHELSHAFLEHDPRPWPDESPLWADEWQLQFLAFWLFQQIHGQSEYITKDLQEQFAASFEPEADGKTPVTVRGFDWYEDTAPEDYLEFVLLLEKFVTDLLARYDAKILLRFLDAYRHDTPLLSEDVTKMLGKALGKGGEAWLEELTYF